MSKNICIKYIIILSTVFLHKNNNKKLTFNCQYSTWLFYHATAHAYGKCIAISDNMSDGINMKSQEP